MSQMTALYVAVRDLVEETLVMDGERKMYWVVPGPAPIFYKVLVDNTIDRTSGRPWDRNACVTVFLDLKLPLRWSE